MKKWTLSILLLLMLTGMMQAAEFTAWHYRVSLVEETGAVRIQGAQHALDLMLFDTESPLAVDRMVPVSENETEIVLRLEAGATTGLLSFREDGLATFAPDTSVGIKLFTDIEYGVVPGFFLVDVIHDLKKSGPGIIHVPSENLAVGLLEGGNAMLVCSWPQGRQKVQFAGTSPSGTAVLSIETDAQPVFFTLFEAPGIWHKWDRQTAQLEKDLDLGWSKPFDADWKTDLWLRDAPLAFLASKGRSTRSWPSIGRSVRPLWFEGQAAFLQIGGRIGTKEDVVIYPLRGHAKTPLSFMEHCSEATAKILKSIYQTRPYPASPRNVPNVGFGACWGSTLLQTTVYQSGAQSRDVAFLKEHMRSRVSSVLGEAIRHQQYLNFAVEQLAMLDEGQDESAGNEEVIAFREQMRKVLVRQQEELAQRMRGGFGSTAEEHMQSAFQLETRLFYLLDNLTEVNNEFYPEFADIMGKYRGLRSMHEGMGMQFGQNMRQLYWAAGQNCASLPQAVPLAEKLRAAIRAELQCRRWETAN